MQLGTYDIPETRLSTSLGDLKKMYDQVQTQPTSSLNIARAFGLVAPTSGGFYRKLSSLGIYGLIRSLGRGTFQITELGVKLLYPPDNEVEAKHNLKQAIMNVQLWADIYKIKQKNLPEKIFSLLSNLTKAEPKDIEKYQDDIRRWYLEDVALVPDAILQAKTYTVNINESVRLNDSVSAASTSQTNKPKTLTIPFEHMSVTLSEEDIVNDWELMQEYMKVYLRKRAKKEHTDSSTTDLDIST